MLTVAEYFSKCMSDQTSDQAMLWKELEVVLRTVCETTALTLRDELLTFVGFNEQHPAVKASLKEIEEQNIIKTIEVKDEKETLIGTEANEIDSDTLTVKEGEGPLEWSVAYPAELKDERKSILTHARIWLLHDFDVIQKWRCRLSLLPHVS